MNKIILILLLVMPSFFEVNAGTTVGKVISVGGTDGTINIGSNWGLKEGMKGKIFYVLEIGAMKKKIIVSSFAVTSVSATKAKIIIFGKKAPVNTGYKLSFNSILRRVKSGAGGVTKRYKARDTGGLFINSVPSGATIFISGKKVKKQTPFLIEKYPVGKYRIELKKDFYFGTAEAVVKKNKITKLNITLKAEPGKIQFTSNPFEAKLFVDGQEKGVTPMLLELKAGRHEVRFEKKFYFPLTKIIYVKGAVKEEKNFKLKPYGFLSLNVVPQDAEILVDGEEFQCPNGVCKKKIDAGKHAILVTRDKYWKFDRKFKLEIGESKNFNIRLKIYPSVKITTKPNKVYVYLEGNKLGRTPLKLDFPDEGEYKFVFKKDKFKDKEEKIVLKAGKTKNLRVTLKALPSVYIKTKPDDAYVYLDERIMGKTPMTISIKKPGKYTVTIQKKYYKKKRFSFEIDYGDALKYNYKLDYQKRYAAQMMAIEQQKKRRTTKQILGWVFTSLGVASLAGSIPFIIQWHSNQSNADSEYDKYKSYDIETKKKNSGLFSETMKKVDDYNSKAKTNYIIAGSMLGVGALSLGFGIYSFLTTPSKPNEEPIVFTPYFDGHNGFLTLKGHF